jgi:NADPH-dependent 2,4-dienoyl-CoA reductase/sulfur reductase-like enzyme
VSSVLLADGAAGCRHGVVGVGIHPGVSWRGGRPEVDNGIVTDATLRTSDPHIFAAGDVANIPAAAASAHSCGALGERSTVAHARSMLGQQVRCPVAVLLDQYDLGMEYSG